MEPDPSYWSGRRVCVTGGTGLLGFQIVRELLNAGARPVVLSLAPHPVHPLNGMGNVDRIVGDIRDPQLVRQVIPSCDVVFHTAGVVAVWGPGLKHIHDVHVGGTRNVLAAASPGTRIVHTSSVVTVGGSPERTLRDEGSPFPSRRLPIDYVHAKREAERIALDAAGAGQDVVVTNPAFLVGPEDYERSLMGRFCRRYWRGQIPIAPPGGFNFIDARDAARGHLLAAEHGQAGRRYILGGENLSFPEFMALLAKVGGLQPRAVPTAPWWTLAALSRGAEVRALLTREHPYPAWQHVLLNRFYWFYRSDRAERELGFTHRPLASCLRDTYAWCTGWNHLKVRGLSRWWMRPHPAQERAIPAPHTEPSHARTQRP